MANGSGSGSSARHESVLALTLAAPVLEQLCRGIATAGLLGGPPHLALDALQGLEDHPAATLTDRDVHPWREASCCPDTSRNHDAPLTIDPRPLDYFRHLMVMLVEVPRHTESPSDWGRGEREASRGAS